MSDAHDFDIAAARERLAGAGGAGYWRSLDELAGDPAFGDFLHHEFPRLAPLWEQAVDRRSALKLMAASLALAGMSGCSRPAEEIVPYVSRPERLVPGRPRYYATALTVGGYAHGVLATSHEGRPTKLEGNPDHPATRGALDAWSQAGVLSLYDPDRSQTVLREGEVATFGAFLADVARRQEAWDAEGGRGLCVLTSALTSPSAAARLAALQRRWPALRRFVHEPAGQANVRAGAKLLFGRRLEPRYRLAHARTVLALDADFMATEPGFLRHARDFMAQRRPEANAMSRLYAIESTPTITGAAADHRHALAADGIEAAARQLARAVGLDVPAPEKPIAGAWVEALAADLRAAGPAALVIPGSGQPPAVHALAHAINAALGAVGAGVVFQAPVTADDGAGDLAGLSEAIDAGTVRDLVILDANPAYTAPGALGFERRLRQVPWRVHWGEYPDETARRCHWHVPATHALESWADARAYDGTVSLVQPLIEPLYAGRTALQFLHALETGVEADARGLLQDYWRRRAGARFDAVWPRWLRAGVVADSAAPRLAPQPRPDWRERLPPPASAGRELVLQLRPDPAILDGRHANNGWLQELPRPLTKLTWTNAALVAPALAERRGLREGDMVRLTRDGRSVAAPVYVLPGHPDGAVTLHLGYGRRAAGRVGDGVGADAYRLRGTGAGWHASGLTLEATGARRLLATTQNHHAMEGRDLIRAADLGHYREDPRFAQRPEPHESLYPEPWPRGEPAERQWGMAIDLNACIGCNACVIACQAENNIPVVGETEVARGHEMHWIRVDRYFEGGPDFPRMVFQPVPCMHCENAPCEYVCPVAATQHSADGLNEMLYNRCVGTRYCSQNCPYKVRRFNWFDYTGPQAEHPAEPAVQNPDVTVRSRGVMEKCTYCVQRIQRAEIEAAAEDLPIPDGGVVTACQEACPTRAITFGDIADPDTEVSRWKASQRNYAMLAELNTRPRTTYLAAVRNPNPDMPEEGGGA